MARSIARSVYISLPKNSGVNLCDLESAANYGLFKASVRYENGIRSFDGYAKLRIRGEILDHLRSLDTVGRKERKRIKASEEPDQKRWFDLEDVSGLSSKDPGPEQSAIREQAHGHIDAAIKRLPERNQRFVRMRHEDDFLLREIGTIWNVTAGRITQIQKSTHDMLRPLLKSRAGLGSSI